MKRRAFVKYTENGKIVPGSLIITQGGYPKGPAVWKEVPVDLCCDSVYGGATLKAYYQQSSFPISAPAFVIYTITDTGGGYQYIFSADNVVVNNLTEFIDLLNQQFSTAGKFYIQDGDAYVTMSDATAAIFAGQDISNLRFEIFND